MKTLRHLLLAASLPLKQLGAEAQKQDAGDGIGITPTAGGARLRGQSSI